MTVYVDAAIHPWRGKLWCHMVADSEQELHDFAKRLGLKREWYQTKSVLPHYDLTEKKQKQAMKLGAIFLSREGICARIELCRTTHCSTRCHCHKWGAWKCAECAVDHQERPEPPEIIEEGQMTLNLLE